MSHNISPRISITLAVISFAVAMIPALGIVMSSDIVGRAIVTTAWLLIGLAWVGQAVHARRARSGE